MQDARQIVDVLYEPIVLRAGACNADRIAFLKCIGTDQGRRHLARNANQRNGVHQGVLKRRDRVGRTRTGCDKHHPNLAGRTRVAFRRMSGALLVTHQNVLNLVLLEEFVIDREHSATGITEDALDALIDQSLNDHFRAGHFARIACFLRFCGVCVRLTFTCSHCSLPVCISFLIWIIKKAPEGACLSRMGAFAGWLHHPAHARPYHKNNNRVHGGGH